MLSLFRRFFRWVHAVDAAPSSVDETDVALRVLFENGAAGISEVDMATHRFVRVNRRFAEMMRRPASQLLTTGPADVIHPVDRERVRDEWLAAMSATGQFDTSVRHIGPSGETIWVRLGVSLWKRDENGAPMRCIAVCQDISENVAITEQLRESEQFLRLGQQIGKIGNFVRYLSTGRLTCSSELCEIFGLPAGNHDFSTETWLASIFAEDRERVIAAMQDAIGRHVPEIDFEYRINRLDGGGPRHIEMRARYEFDSEGRPVRSSGVVMDVTERKKVENRLRESETLLRLGMAAGGIGAYQRDFQKLGDIICGPETQAMLGVEPGDEPVPVAVWLATVLPEDAVRLTEEFQEGLASRRSDYSSHYCFRKSPDSPIRHVEIRAHTEYDAEGRPLTSTGVIIDVTRRIEAEQQLAHAARHDALTGLPNRVLFRERMDTALARARRGEQFALLCLDLDRFKEINDTLGHPVGDSLLVEVSARLRGQLRETDSLARLGGDEFAIIQSGLTTPNDSASFAQRLIDSISAPYEVDGHTLVVGVSVGIAVAPEDGEQYEDLFKAADMALYRAKAEGRGAWRWFEPEMNERMQTRRTLEVDLRRALERGEFELFYQPIVETATRRIKSFEALVRWRHPERGLIPPDAFIPLCEDIGLIVPLGAWVLGEACAEAARWPEPLGVAVNISPLQFTGRKLVETVDLALKRNGLAAHRLEVEITETTVLQNTDATLAILRDLKTLGVRIAMDDFGTGYSSLSSLQSFPFDKVKIDRSFTRGLDQSRQNDAIVTAMIHLCEALDICATAEGVETEAQLAFLRRRGCREAQGYLFSRPCPAGEVAGLISQLGVCAEWPQAAE